MAFMALHRIGVADGPALAVFVAYKGLAVITDLAGDAGYLGGGVLHLIVLHGVLSHQAKRRKNRKGEEDGQQSFHVVLFSLISEANCRPAPLVRRFCWGRVVVRVRMPPSCGRR